MLYPLSFVREQVKVCEIQYIQSTYGFVSRRGPIIGIYLPPCSELLGYTTAPYKTLNVFSQQRHLSNVPPERMAKLNKCFRLSYRYRSK